MIRLGKQAFLVAILLTISSCVSEIDKNASLSTDANRIKTFYAITEGSGPDTKVFADANMKVLWNADDRLTIFNQSTYNYQFKFTGDDGDNAGGFEEVPASGFISGNALSNVYAVYAYSSANKINNAGTTITLALPAEQAYKEHSFGIGANTMIAVTNSNFLAFKNVGGYLSLRLYGDNVSVSRITLQGNNHEKIAGKAEISVGVGAAPAVTMTNEATETISIVCDPAVKLGTSSSDYTDFWFVIPPVTFTKGFTVTVTDNLGGTFEVSTSKSFTISRSTVEWMSPLKVVPNPKFPALRMKGMVAYTKMAALLDSYTSINNPANNKAIMTIDANEIAINASRSMKAFIMGTAEGNVDTQVYNYEDKEGNMQNLVASYGLEGAFAALLHDKSTMDQEAIDSEDALTAMNAAWWICANDIDSLSKGFAAYKPYTDALAEYAEAVNNETTDVAAMIQAVKDLKRVLYSVDGISSKRNFTYNDSMAVLNAFVAFGKAREQYLDYSPMDAKGNKKAKDSTYFVFAISKTGGKVNIDSVKFSALSFDDLRAHKYDYKDDGTAYVGGASIVDFCPCNNESGLAHIADQLLGPEVAAKLAAYPTTTATVTTGDLIHGNAFYHTYMIDDYAKPTTILNADGTPYVPAAIAAAEKKVKAAAGKFINVYNRFWAENIAKDIADAEYDAYFAAADKNKAKKLAAAEKKVKDKLTKEVAYTLMNFKDPNLLVAFDGNEILFTNAMGVFLGSVDPNKTVADGSNFNNSGKVSTDAAVFYGPNTADFDGKTAFYNYLKATDTYYKSLESFSTSLQEIRAWIDVVDDALDNITD